MKKKHDADIQYNITQLLLKGHMKASHCNYIDGTGTH